MAGIAGLFGGNVGIVFAAGNVTVMATFAGTGHYRVIHTADPAPTESGVAELAGITGTDMVTVLALGSRTVVTGETATLDGTVIETGHMPADCGMAIITAVVTLNVIDRLTGRIGIVVAAVTHHRCALELPLVMTLIALHVAMFTSERKAGFKMVELGALGVDEIHQ